MHQEVRAESGFAYGVIGGDINVFGDGTPLYVLETWRPAPSADPEHLRQLPSRMLNARFAVVPFTGRQQELADLRHWRDEGARLAVRWLHAPGGQGKSRLADEFARASLAEGWKVVTAVQGPGTVLPPPGSQDLRPDGDAGLLLLVDYADRWPLSHLTALFSNALLHRTGVRTRVLLLGRSAETWPALRGALANHQAATSAQALAPLPGDDGTGRRARLEMFTTARDSFAAHYGATAAGIGPPGSLQGPDFGLTLAVHIAALVAVDARAAGLRPPSGMTGLTVYLLDREHLHWQNLFGDGVHELDPAGRGFGTAPGTMNRAVFVAALTGTLARPAAAALLGALRLEPAERILTDHAVCYPPAGSAPGAVLEPLYPDRLAEDFIALTVPGHTADYPAQPWATPTADLLLDRAEDRTEDRAEDRTADRTAPPWTPRSVTFLAAAAERWPHLGPGYLYPLLREDPGLAVTAGSAALTALARIPAVDPAVLEAVAGRFPAHRHSDLDPGIAAVATRLTAYQLAGTDDPARRARLHITLAKRQSHAGLHTDALASAGQAVRLYRDLSRTGGPPSRPHQLANALLGLGNSLAETGRSAEAVTADEETVRILRALARADPAGHDPAGYGAELATALANLGIHLGAVGRFAEALTAERQAVEIRERLAGADPSAHRAALATSLNNLVARLAALGQHREALAAAERAVRIRRQLADADPAWHSYELATSLGNLGSCLMTLGRRAEALTAGEAAVGIWRRLAHANPAAYDLPLADALSNLGNLLREAGRPAEARPTAAEAVECHRRLARSNPAAFEPRLATSLNNLGLCLSGLGHHQEALAAAGEAVGIGRRLLRSGPAAHAPDLAMALTNLGNLLAGAGRPDEALAAAEQATALYRRLAQDHPDAHRAGLAASLNNLGNRLAEAGRASEALAVTEEAATLYQRLARQNPDAHQADLAMALLNLGTGLAETGRYRKALAAVERSVALYQPLAGADPAAYTAALAHALVTSAAVRLVWGRDLRGALRSAESAVAICTGPAEQLPSVFTAPLRQALELRAALLDRLGGRSR